MQSQCVGSSRSRCAGATTPQHVEFGARISIGLFALNNLLEHFSVHRAFTKTASPRRRHPVGWAAKRVPGGALMVGSKRICKGLSLSLFILIVLAAAAGVLYAQQAQPAATGQYNPDWLKGMRFRVAFPATTPPAAPTRMSRGMSSRPEGSIEVSHQHGNRQTLLPSQVAG